MFEKISLENFFLTFFPDFDSLSIDFRYDVHLFFFQTFLQLALQHFDKSCLEERI